MRKNSKTNDVLQHLLKYGKINTMEAIDLYGATRLSAIIFNLRHKYELNIINERVDFIDRNGRTSHFDNYLLVKDDEEIETLYVDEVY